MDINRLHRVPLSCVILISALLVAAAVIILTVTSPAVSGQDGDSTDVSVRVRTTASGYRATDGDMTYHLGSGDELSVQAQADVPLSERMTVAFYIDADGDAGTTDDREHFTDGDEGRVTVFDDNDVVFRVMSGDEGYLFYTISDITDEHGGRFNPVTYTRSVISY